MSRAFVALSIVLEAVLVGGCSGPLASPDVRVLPAVSASTFAALATPSLDAVGATELRFGCSEAVPCRLTPGTYVLSGEFAFMPGMRVSIGVPASSAEQDLGEFSLSLAGAPGGLLFWKDLTPVDHNGRPVTDVDRSAAGLTRWLQHNKDLVTSSPRATTIGDAIPATTFLIGVSTSAKNADPDCPVSVCVPTFTDTAHWDVSNAIGRQAKPLYVRLFLADVISASSRHTLVLALDAGDALGLERLEPLAKPVIESVRLPPGTRPA